MRFATTSLAPWTSGANRHHELSAAPAGHVRVSEIWVPVRCDPPKIITHLPILVEHASCPQHPRDCNYEGKADHEAEADQTEDRRSPKRYIPLFLRYYPISHTGPFQDTLWRRWPSSHFAYSRYVAEVSLRDPASVRKHFAQLRGSIPTNAAQVRSKAYQHPRRVPHYKGISQQ